jgi:hypothetical protein
VTSTRRAAALAAVALSSLVAACGSSGNGEESKTADQIVADAKAALKAATSYHLVGTVSPGNKPTKIDIKVAGAKSSSGHVDQDGVVFDYIDANGKLYIRGKALFASYSQAAADLIGDQWVTATGNASLESAATSVTGLSDSAQLADSLGSSGGPFSKGGTKTVNGQPAIAITNKDGEMDVATSGAPYPVRLDAGAKGQMSITEYGAHFDISAPSKALDASSLGSLSSGQSSPSPSASGATKAVVDAVQMRDAVLSIGQSTISSSSGTADDAWGVGQKLAGVLPSSIDIVVQTGSLSGQSPATPTKLVLVGQQTSSGTFFLVVVKDSTGNCEVGALTGNPPNANPVTRSLSSAQDCTAAAAVAALQS